MTATRSRTRVTGWVGWIAFGAVMIGVAGLFNLITGWTAVLSDDVYVRAGSGVLVLDVTGWGWAHVVLGLLMLVTSVSLMVGQTWARFAAVALVVVNLVTQLLLMPAYPYWALLTIAVDLMVVWALVVHGEEIEGL